MSYLTKFDEINRLSKESWNSYSEKSSTDKSKELSDELFEFLIDAYLLGFYDVNAQLGMEEKPSVSEMNSTIYRKIEEKTFEDRVHSHVKNDDEDGFALLVENEFHRVYNESGNSAAGRSKGTVYRQWNTVGDDRVRDTHDYINKLIVPYSEEFYTFDGDHAPYPSGFQKAENNIGCRCWLTYVRED